MEEILIQALSPAIFCPNWPREDLPNHQLPSTTEQSTRERHTRWDLPVKMSMQPVMVCSAWAPLAADIAANQDHLFSCVMDGRAESYTILGPPQLVLSEPWHYHSSLQKLARS